MSVASGAAGQAPAVPGVTDKAVTIGFISSQSGVASSGNTNAHKSCRARVDAENAKGGVNGRKIKLEIVDDQSGGNLTAAQDLVRNRNVFAIVDDSALAFLAYRFIRDAGVPMIGAGFDGTYYYDKGNENIISGLGNSSPVPGLTYDTVTRLMKKMGVTKVAAVGYGISPSSSAAAKAFETYAADAQGLRGAYLNNTLQFGGTDVGAVVLGIKNSGADGLYLPLDAQMNFNIVQGLQQSGVRLKSTVLATGYTHELLDQPIVHTITPREVISAGYRPVELGGKAIKQFQANLERYAGLTGVPDYGMYTGYIDCDLLIRGLAGAGRNLTRQRFVDAIRNGGPYDAAGLTCRPMDFSLANFGKIDPTNCSWFVSVKNGKFVVLNGGKPLTGKLVGDPDLLAKYEATAPG